MRPPLAVRGSGADDDVVASLVEAQVASRLGARNATLWGEPAESEASIRLGWVDLALTSRPLLAEVEALRAEFWSEGVDEVLLCGMGGSSLAPEVIARTFEVPLQVLDSTHPGVIRRATSADLSRKVVVVSSKSGGSLETECQRRALMQAMTDQGIDAASRMVVITDPGTALEALGRAEGYRRVFLADPDVGGRYSALSAFGLVPTGLAGVDIAELLDEAEEVMGQLFADSPDNPALILAAAMAGRPSRNKLAIADAQSGIVGFPDWAEQLIAESTGKSGKGVLPVAVEGVDAPEIRWPAADVVACVLRPATVPESPEPNGLGDPRVTVAGTLGAQLLTWEAATAVAGTLIGINPFDQPDVESAKAAARGLLEQQPEPEPARLIDGDIEIRGSKDLLDGVESLDEAVDALLGRLEPEGYLAVMAYLDPERDRVLTGARRALALRTERPTTFGWGPRYLHSTGQFHKGGPPQGVFMLITSEEADDIDIPDRPFSFAALLAAQAAGDASVLTEHGRPLLRLHLAEPAGGVTRLLQVLR